MEDGSSALSAASPPAPSGSDSSSTDLPTRIVVSLLACSIVSWQLLETAKLPSAADEKRCCAARGSPLQWWLLGLMLLSVIEGVLMTLADLVLLARRDPAGGVSAAEMRQELNLTLAIGHADQVIVSLMIIGLGVSGCRSGVKYARVAVGLGAAALLSRRLPAPLLLVGGVSCLQRATRLQDGLQGGLQSEAEPRAREAREVSVREACGCFSLRCALRPLLALAMLEAFYSSIPPSQLEEGMRQAKRDGTLRPLAEAAGPDADQVLFGFGLGLG